MDPRPKIIKWGLMTGPEMRATRDLMELDKAAFGRLLGYTRQSVHRWESGEQKIPPAVAIAYRWLACED